MEMLTNKKEIEAWLNKYEIENYSINSDLSVDVQGSVLLRHQNLSDIPVKFNRVQQNFNCSYNQLTTLRWAPESVGGDFECYQNRLNSLVGAPKSVGGFFDCDHNELTSLIGAPEKIKGIFYCLHNQLTSLTGAPKMVENDFNCGHNFLTSLQGAPDMVLGGFACHNNQLSTLEFCPREVVQKFYCDNNPRLEQFQDVNDFSIIKAEHLRIQAVLREKQLITESLGHGISREQIGAFKI